LTATNVTANHTDAAAKLVAVKAVDAAKVALADHLHTIGSDDAAKKSL
jgi:hypothetical protein